MVLEVGIEDSGGWGKAIWKKPTTLSSFFIFLRYHLLTILRIISEWWGNMRFYNYLIVNSFKTQASYIKMLNILRHHRNENQTYIEILGPPVRMTVVKKTNSKTLVGMGAGRETQTSE